jgi:GH18 family chitinase
VKTYAEIIDAMEKQFGKNNIDWFDMNEETFDGFIGSSPNLVKTKTEWSKTVGLGGVMFWELGQDKLNHPASLLNAAVKGMLPLKKKSYNNQLEL